MEKTEVRRRPLAPLEITCTSTECDKNLHCFRQTRQMKLTNQWGMCRACGAQLVDWGRVHQRDISDAAYTVSALRYEKFRHYFWHVQVDQRAVNYALRKGSWKLREAVEGKIRKSIGAASPVRDGYQTPREGSGNPIHYGQHGTASCCRVCVEYWHGIPRGRELTDDEVSYLADLVMRYISERIPDLAAEGQRIPPISKER